MAALSSDSLPSNTYTPLSVHASPPLEKLIKHILQKSDNMYADQMLHLLSLASGGAGTLSHGLDIVVSHLRGLGIDTTQFRFVDGSGLSRLNWMSGRALTKLLASAFHHKYFSNFQKALIEIHTSDDRWSRFYSRSKVMAWVKSGTLNGTTSIAGFAKTTSGRHISFSFQVSNTLYARSKIYDLAADCLKAACEQF